MILFQQAVAADAKYTFSNKPNMTVFDVHNDSPLNMGISFGTDTGISNPDYYTSPHSILTGIGPIGSAQRSVGGVKWNGTVYIYTQTPMGGGTTNLTSAPASQITVIGYATGYNPSATVSLSRMSNVGNSVNTVGGTSSSIQNDANVAGTSVVEATVAGDGSSAVSLTNQGRMTLGSAANNGSLELIGASGTVSITTNGDLNVSNGVRTITNLIQAQNLNDVGLHAQSGNRVVGTIGGIDTFSVDENGANLIAGTLKLLVGSISRVSVFSANVSTTSTFFNHGLGAIPDFVICCVDGSAVGNFSCLVHYPSMTTTQVKLTASASFVVVGLAIKL